MGKNNRMAYLGLLVLLVAACGGTQSIPTDEQPVKEVLTEKNRMTVSLLEQIRRLPGITIRNGVPVFVKSTSEISGGNRSYEPLYIIDGYPMGNSFSTVNGLVNNINIKKIETLSGSDASFYGARGGNGVILITTKE